MDSLSLMYQMGLKNQAAYALPQQLQNDQQIAAQKLRADTLANDQSQAMNPLDQMFKQGQINQQGANLATTQAQLPGVVGQSQSLASQGAIDQATQDSKIDVKNSDNKNQMGVNQAQTLAREGQVASMTAQALSQFPPALHKEAAAEIMKQYGVTEDSPLYHVLGQLPPNKVAAGLSHIGDGMVKTSAEYIKSMALQESKNRNDVQTTGMNNSTSLGVANITAGARIQAAEARAQMMYNTMDINKKITYLSDAVAQGVATPAEKKELNDLKNHQRQVSAARVPTLPNRIMGAPTQIESVTAPDPDPAQPQDDPAATIQPNQLQIDHLKAHPELRDAFDAKFGKGSSTSILGK